MIGLSEERLQHCLAVARKMKDLAERIPGFEDSPEDMFYLGLLHDAAYEFVDTQEDHEHKGGELLHHCRFKYWREVFFHGDPDAKYHSQALDLLNYADMTTDLQGNQVSIEERLTDIANRYGVQSIQYQKANRLAQKLSSSIFG